MEAHFNLKSIINLNTILRGFGLKTKVGNQNFRTC